MLRQVAFGPSPGRYLCDGQPWSPDDSPMDNTGTCAFGGTYPSPGSSDDCRPHVVDGCMVSPTTAFIHRSTTRCHSLNPLADSTTPLTGSDRDEL